MSHELMQLHDAKDGKPASWRMGNNKDVNGTDRASLDKFFRDAHGRTTTK
jgi:hypothetical protein